MNAYPVKSLVILLNQINERWPKRDKSNDGWIGDEAHAARKSEHNPDVDGSVDARDITNDPPYFDAHAFANHLQKTKDKRIKNIISNRRILAGDNGPRPWEWRKYSGSNPHNKHIHIDVLDKYQDDVTSWIMPPLIEDFIVEGMGKGSWYSQYNGKYVWYDSGDNSNSNKLGVHDSKQGFAMYDATTLGKWREVRAPNGVVLLLQQTDIGPHPNTGRKIDIAAVAAEAYGYSPKNFPTDKIFVWGPIKLEKPEEIKVLEKSDTYDPNVKELQKLLGFNNKQQDGYFGEETEKATIWFQRRSGLDVDGIVGPNTWKILKETYKGKE